MSMIQLGIPHQLSKGSINSLIVSQSLLKSFSKQL
jgi:hypothetical protein